MIILSRGACKSHCDWHAGWQEGGCSVVEAVGPGEAVAALHHLGEAAGAGEDSVEEGGEDREEADCDHDETGSYWQYLDTPCINIPSVSVIIV